MTQRVLTFVVSLAASAVIGGMLGYQFGRNHAGVTFASESPAATPRVDRPTAVAAHGVVAEAPPPGAQWDERWKQAQTGSWSPRSERAQADLLVELASHDPQRALSIALAEHNLRVRAELRNAALRGWASTDAQAATEYALGLREDERRDAMAAVFAGAAADSPAALRVAGEACDRDSARAFEYTQALVAKLGEVGQFATALQFLASRPAQPQRLEEADNAFAFWAAHQPADAAAAAEALADPDLRAAAFRGTVVGWSQADPAGLAEYATRLEPGESRSVALANAVPRWVEQDPTAAVNWINQHAGDADLDSGIAAVANLPGIVKNQPTVAIDLAKSISDAPLRENTLQNLVLRWAQSDAASAGQFVANSPLFSDGQRALVLAQIQGDPAH
jgi:hypothetical protein